MYGDSPCRFQRNLGEATYLLLFYLVSLFIKSIFKVLPFHGSHVYHLVIALNSKTFFLIIRDDFTYFTIIILFLWRRVILYEHHLRAHFQFKIFFCRIGILREYPRYLRFKSQRLRFESVEFLLIDFIGLRVMRRKSDITFFVFRIEVGKITSI